MVYEIIANFFMIFLSILIILNPFSTASIFLSITPGKSKQERSRMAKKSTLTSLVVLVLFALAGNSLLRFFSITIEAFTIAGGVLLAHIGYTMVNTAPQYFHTEDEEQHAKDLDDVSIIPLSIPMTSGPGAITTVILFANNITTYLDLLLLLLSIVLALLCSYTVLKQAHVLERFSNPSVKRIVDKLLGLIILVLGVQFLINGSEKIVLKFLEETNRL